MGGAALHEIELQGACLASQLISDNLGQDASGSCNILMAEPVGTVAGSLFRQIVPIFIPDALADSNQQIPVFRLAASYVVQKPADGKGHFAEVNKIRPAAAVYPGKGRGCGEPAGVASHDFHNGNSEGIIHSHIPLQFREGGGNIFGRRGKTGAVVNFHQIVVNGLWRADDFYILNLLGTAVPGQLIHCVHGVIPAYVYEIGDVIFPENINQNPVLGSILFRPGQLEAAGTQGGGRGLGQFVQVHCVIDMIQQIYYFFL